MQTLNSMGWAHWVYLLGVVVIVITMILRANVVVPSIVGTFLVALAWSGSPLSALGSIFTASFVAAKSAIRVWASMPTMRRPDRPVAHEADPRNGSATVAPRLARAASTASRSASGENPAG